MRYAKTVTAPCGTATGMHVRRRRRRMLRPASTTCAVPSGFDVPGSGTHVVVEDVAELCARGRAACRPARKSAAAPRDHRDRAQVVDAVGVIGMFVREQHGVHAVDSGRDQLKSQLGRRVDEQSRARVCSRPPRRRAFACRADRATGRPRNGSRSAARRSSCRCRGR